MALGRSLARNYGGRSRQSAEIDSRLVSVSFFKNPHNDTGNFTLYDRSVFNWLIGKVAQVEFFRINRR